MFSDDVLQLREQVIGVAYPMFVHRGIRDVSLEDIERAAGVSANDLARAFGSKDELATAFLERREREWTIGVVEAGARERGATPEERLLAIFDVFDEWFSRDDYEACTFINVLLEMGKDSPVGRASVDHLRQIRLMVARLAVEAHLRDPDEFAWSWHILMKGSIISAVEGDGAAARRAKRMARALIKEYRPVRSETPPRFALTPTDSSTEWLVLVESAWQNANPPVALLREDSPGRLFCYPNLPGYGRLGPYPSAAAALDALAATPAPSHPQ